MKLRTIICAALLIFSGFTELGEEIPNYHVIEEVEESANPPTGVSISGSAAKMLLYFQSHFFAIAEKGWLLRTIKK